MLLDPHHLSALAAILRHGSFEAAASELSVTPSAISQRIKALEDRVGAALIHRGTPCTGTPAGLRITRHAEDIGLLEAKLARGGLFQLLQSILQFRVIWVVKQRVT